MQASLAEAEALQSRGSRESDVTAHRHLTSSAYFAFKQHQFTGGFNESCAMMFTRLNEAICASDLPVDPSAFEL